MTIVHRKQSQKSSNDTLFHNTFYGLDAGYPKSPNVTSGNFLPGILFRFWDKELFLPEILLRYWIKGCFCLGSCV
jgi:hypothetical protein